jgi:hypothetical protein
MTTQFALFQDQLQEKKCGFSFQSSAEVNVSKNRSHAGESVTNEAMLH